jgi:hypothetical protein
MDILPPFIPGREAPELLQPSQQRLMQPVPLTCRLPVAEPTPAGHAGSAARLSRRHLSRDAGLEDTDEGGAIGDAEATALGCGRLRREQGGDAIPRLVRNERERSS